MAEMCRKIATGYYDTIRRSGQSTQAARQDGDVHESVDATVDPAKRHTNVTTGEESGGGGGSFSSGTK
jgi:hypothetical protein